jgi:hypothetical protein
MADQPPSEEQRAQQTKQQSRTAERPPSAKTQDKPNVLTAHELSTPVNTKELSSIESGKQIATAGRGGECNLVIQWVEETWIDGSPYYSCYALSYRIDIRTLPSHGLEVIKEQLSYKKTYTATGALRTQLMQ